MNENNLDCSVALSYFLDSNAPIIVASGKGDVAKKIREIAKQNNVSIIKNANLAKILVNEEIGSCIPKETFMLVASVFAFLVNANKKEFKNVTKN